MLLLSPLGRDVATLTNHIIQIANPMVAQPSRPHTLIAGGAGFIGSHLCERFLEDGHRVTCVDNLLTGRLENVDHLLDRTDFTFLHQDISAQLDVGTDFDYMLVPMAWSSLIPTTSETGLFGSILSFWSEH
ncbi:MAG: GDP-mannose 4,6-dehydratase [Rhodothermales bacterium]|nr:GDP-mannose 4,6-dehydratase [Rhodothermales bacterium]MDG2015986.1 GDP-mannose 4,6-dehydratase [Rhodothermales bacterium]